MIAKTLLSLVCLASLQSQMIVKASDGDLLNGSSFSQECLQTTEEINAQDEGDRETELHFESNMDDLVDRLQEKVLYMRTTDLKVCSTNHFIHGMRVALKHDITKDPANNSKLDNFYSSGTKIVSDHNLRFYEHYVGFQEGKCKKVHLERGERII